MKLHGTISRDVDWTAYRIIDKIQTHHRLGEKGLVSERENDAVQANSHGTCRVECSSLSKFNIYSWYVECQEYVLIRKTNHHCKRNETLQTINSRVERDTMDLIGRDETG